MTLSLTNNQTEVLWGSKQPMCPILDSWITSLILRVPKSVYDC